MARNRFNTQSMKDIASKIETELVQYEAAQRELENIISELRLNWDDDQNRRFENQFQNKAKPTIDDIGKKMKEYAAVLHQCAKRYGATIDNGNSRFTW